MKKNKKSNKNNFKEINETIIDLYYNLGNIQDDELKKKISANTDIFPMYDISTENIYLVLFDEIYVKLIDFNFRPITKEIYEIIKKTNSEKMINFLTNFDIEILTNTFYKIIYNSNPKTEELTNCLRPSYLPVFKFLSPYYYKTEMIYMAMNLGLWKSGTTLDNLCEVVKMNDVNSRKLFEHQQFIKYNYADNYIKYYSFIGSLYFNNYLRFPEKYVNERDINMEQSIKNFRNLLIKSPGWDKSYYFYRWINNDSFLQNLKTGDIYEEKGFMSTTRQPFIDPKTHYFGYILLKIKVPKNIEGTGLAIEYYSNFNNELEIVFPPSKFKLVELTNTEYYHPNQEISNKIISKYEFEWIEHLENYIDPLNYKEELVIKSINTDETEINMYNNSINKHETFLNIYGKKCKGIIGYEREFEIGKILSGAYDDFFYLNIVNNSEFYRYRNNSEKCVDVGIYMISKNNKTGKINLFIEIGQIISVNYYSKFIDFDIDYEYDDLIIFLKDIGKLFKIEQIIIHPSSKKYVDIINLPLIFDNYKYNINNIINNNKNKNKNKNNNKNNNKSLITIADETYHNKQLYISDCFYYNDILFDYLIDNNKRSLLTNSNFKINCGTEVIEKLFNMSLKEFIDISKPDNDIIIDTSILKIIKLGNKILNGDVQKISLLNKEYYLTRKTLSDLYIYIMNSYYYLIMNLHNLIYHTLNINLNNIYFQYNNDVYVNFSINLYSNKKEFKMIRKRTKIHIRL